MQKVREKSWKSQEIYSVWKICVSDDDHLLTGYGFTRIPEQY